MEFAYRVTGTGWSEARLADDRHSVIITASYLSDALGNLLEAVGLLLEGVTQSRCSWDEEPGEHRWIFERDGSDVHLRVLAFRDQMEQEPDERGVVVFETTQPLSVIAAAIADGAETALAENGERGYLNRWLEHPFPSGHLAMIRERLARM